MAQRTIQQNKSLHKWFELVEDYCAKEGHTIDELMIEPVEIPITKQFLKDYYRALLRKMYGKTSTADMTTAEVDKVFDVMNKHIGQTIGVHVPFPNEADRHLLDNN